MGKSLCCGIVAIVQIFSSNKVDICEQEWIQTRVFLLKANLNVWGLSLVDFWALDLRLHFLQLSSFWWIIRQLFAWRYHHLTLSTIVFGLRPSAKDQGITWVVVVLLLVLVHHLAHFLLKINSSESNLSLPGNRTGVLLLPSQALYQLSYGNIDTNCWKIIYLT